MNLSLFHLVKEPKVKKDKNPLLLLLHGYGSNEEDLFSFAPELPKQYYIISARAPYPLPPYGNAWYSINFDADQNKFSDNEQAIKSRDLIVSFLDEVINNYPIDPNDITLIGFSQGSILSQAIALSYPKKIKQIIALSGYLNTDILISNFQEKDFSKLKVFISHGTADQIIPITWARETSDFLKKLGVAITYKEYPIGHGVSPENFYDFKNWLENN